MRVMDLFSGIGGFSLGLKWAGGFETTSFCEIDPYCRKVLRKHWPNVPIKPDITRRDFFEGEADVITAGFPCQDISFAGKGAGLAGPRSGLWREVVRAIRVVRPKYVVLENVAALLNRGLGQVLGNLAEVGYDAEWDCIPASAVGAPHRRDRWWGLAYPHSSKLWLESRWGNGTSRQNSSEPRDDGSQGHVADAHHSSGLEQSQRCFSQIRRWLGNGSETLGNQRAWWSIEPNVGRVAHGIPSRLDRLRGLGNAVVPQIPELIGRALTNTERAGIG